MSLGVVAKAAAGAGIKSGLMAAYGLDARQAVAYGLQGLAFNLVGTFFPPFAALNTVLGKFRKERDKWGYSVQQRDMMSVLGLGGAAQYFLQLECMRQDIPVYAAQPVIRSHARKDAWLQRGLTENDIYIDAAGNFEFLVEVPTRTELEHSIAGVLGLRHPPVIGHGDVLERERQQGYFGYRVEFTSGRAEHLVGYFSVLKALGFELPLNPVRNPAATSHARHWSRPFKGSVLPFGVDLVLDGNWHVQSRIGQVAQVAGTDDDIHGRNVHTKLMAVEHVEFADSVVVELGPLDWVRRQEWQNTGQVVIQAQTFYKNWAPEFSVVEPLSRTEGGWLSSLSSFLSSLVRGIADFFRSLFNAG